MIQTLDRSSPVRRSRVSPRIVAGAMALVGAALMATGVVLPWFSLFAGLQPINAIGTSNGLLLLVAAGATGLLGLLALTRHSSPARRGLTALGILLTAFSAYLVVGLVTVFREVSADPMVVAQLGPGLLFVGVGAIVVLATALIGD